MNQQNLEKLKIILNMKLWEAFDHAFDVNKAYKYFMNTFIAALDNACRKKIYQNQIQKPTNKLQPCTTNSEE